MFLPRKFLRLKYKVLHLSVFMLLRIPFIHNIAINSYQNYVEAFHTIFP